MSFLNTNKQFLPKNTPCWFKQRSERKVPGMIQKGLENVRMPSGSLKNQFVYWHNTLLYYKIKYCCYLYSYFYYPYYPYPAGIRISQGYKIRNFTEVEWIGGGVDWKNKWSGLNWSGGKEGRLVTNPAPNSLFRENT